MLRRLERREIGVELGHELVGLVEVKVEVVDLCHDCAQHALASRRSARHARRLAYLAHPRRGEQARKHLDRAVVEQLDFPYAPCSVIGCFPRGQATRVQVQDRAHLLGLKSGDIDQIVARLAVRAAIAPRRCAHISWRTQLSERWVQPQNYGQ
jgi:hypothetical protein